MDKVTREKLKKEAEAIKKRSEAAKKRSDTIERKRIEEETKRATAAAKRNATIAARQKADEKRAVTKARHKKFMELSSKPIVWVSAIFGWLMAIYWLFKFAVWILRSLGYL